MTSKPKKSGSLTEKVDQPVGGKEEDSKVATFLLKQIRTYRNWHECVMEFLTTDVKQRKISALHEGYNTSIERSYGGGLDEPTYTEEDRAIFYLKVADGYKQVWDHQIPEDEGKKFYDGFDKFGQTEWKVPTQLRQEVALKAFIILCQNFFNLVLYYAKDIRQFDGRWESFIVSEKLFPSIQNFFRFKKQPDGDINVRNLPYGKELSHNEQIVVTFLKNLAIFLWEGWKEREVEGYLGIEYRKRTEEANASRARNILNMKLWMIEILSQLREINLVEKWLPTFEPACLEKMREIAMRATLSPGKHPVKQERKVNSVAEAVLAGSRSAKIIALHEIAVNEINRLKPILDLECEIEHAQRKLALFGPPKK